MKPRVCVRRENGAASLLVTLVLMMSITLITLSVARTQLTETRMAGNTRAQARLLLAAESAWAKAAALLRDDAVRLQWTPAGDGTLASRSAAVSGDGDIDTAVVYRRAYRDSPFIDIQASATAHGGAGPSGQVRQTVRLLTVLSPLAESAPPLVINGCLSPGNTRVAIRPARNGAQAGDALWRYTTTPCPALGAVDVYGGRTVSRHLDEPLWEKFFSVSRDEYARLAASENALPADRRRYWRVGPNTPGHATWRRSLGSPERPVVLVFPAETGCPRFGAGVRIVGLVFIDATCPQPLADRWLEIAGSLVINGDLALDAARVDLQHIQAVDPGRTRLALPVLRLVAVPGSWKDF